MENTTTKKRQFHMKNRLLTLYLSIGIIGICMLFFSAWTPLSAAIGTSATPDRLHNSEHIPSVDNKLDSAGDNVTSPDNSSGNPSDSEEGNNNQEPSAAPATDIPTPTPSPTVTPSPTPTPNPLLTNAYPEINSLVEEYYNAKLVAEEEAFTSLVSDQSAIDIDYLRIQYGLVTDFSNFTCYTKNGINEIAYVVYVSYDSKIVTIDTPVPILDSLTLVYADDGSGRLLINTAPSLSDETTAYCSEIFTHEDVTQMVEKETERFENALASDAALRQLYNRFDSEDVP